MNQGELEIAKQGLLNTAVPGFSALKWTGMGHFQSGSHSVLLWKYKLRRNIVALTLRQIVAWEGMGYNLRSERILLIRLPGKPITIIQVCVPITEAEEDEIESFYANIQEEIDHAPKQDMLIKIRGDWNAKVGNKVESTAIGKF